MASFVMLGKYSAESVQEISGKRTREASRIIKKYKGKVKSMHVLLGECDMLFLVDFPSTDNLVKASIALTKATGISFSTSVAVPVAEFDKLVASI